MPAPGARSRKLAAERLGERPADGQPEPQASGAASQVVVALLERVEDPRQDLGIDADARVFKLDRESSRLGFPLLDRLPPVELVVRIVSRPPDGVNLAALRIRFQTTCMIRA